MPKTTPFLWFDKQAAEAAEFYVSLFPNSRITHVSRYGPGTPGTEGAVMTVSFSLDGTDFVALNGGPDFRFTEAISFQIDCATQEEVDHYWYGLTAGGGEEGDCGWLKDRYGLSWQVVPTALFELLGDPDGERAGRATQAMLRMHRLDIAELRRAADGAPARAGQP
ncbi:VOC family protein [Frankia sp. CNm7]|uniref:VOC family protein n=1 Tax=Frankia nepalensis TaxID=1836974 RepID=A0A937RBJ4_9ACTN|nr:VOC family protein [Frankia nepalensis]MBL7499101.1 VOC family protein [Frankia nepalensis]MBL7515217.1 VOC family protein [Frankia nepalensis]MBL7519944.1 VOC family protein [Frankia nepalensis]MBL7625894.1 VOC family protein [Frankia nepalensis]